MRKTCVMCGNSRDLGRKLCLSCYRVEKRLYAKKRYTEKGRTLYTIECIACKKDYSKATRKEQMFCSNCYKRKKELAKKASTGINPYIYVGHIKGKTLWKHRELAKNIMKRDLNSHEVVHHMDHDPLNNTETNLVVLSDKAHRNLHDYLNTQRVILEKSSIENFENCWKTLIVPMTTAWLEMTNVNVIKLWEIGQPAAELLSGYTQEEGSETMHKTSVTDKAVDDDIVQTTTE